MNHHGEDPDNLGGLGDMLPADVLKRLNELLEQLHRKDKDHQGSPVFIYAPGSQYVDKQFNIGAYHHPQASPQPSPKGKGDESAEALKKLPDVLATDKAMELWEKAQAAGWIDGNYQPLISRTQAALLADIMAERLGIRKKWKVFEALWHRTKMYKDYYKAIDQKQYWSFQNKLKQILD